AGLAPLIVSLAEFFHRVRPELRLCHGDVQPGRPAGPFIGDTKIGGGIWHVPTSSHQYECRSCSLHHMSTVTSDVAAGRRTCLQRPHEAIFQASVLLEGA